MEQRLSMVTLGVADLGRAVAFYERVVGWKPSPGTDGIAFFDLAGTVFSLYPHSELAKDIKADTDSGRDGAYEGIALAHNVSTAEEVDSIFARLTEGGATIVKQPEPASWGGYSGYFRDPDGHTWEVAYNPYWTILDDGSVSMATD